MFKKYLEMSKQDTIADIECLLVEAGYGNDVKYGRHADLENRVFYKDGIDKVFIVIVQNTKNYPKVPTLVDFVVIDREIYDTYFKDSKYAFISINNKGKKDKAGKLLTTSEFIVNSSANNMANVKIHRAVLDKYGVDIKGYAIDHISHCRNINTFDTLRACKARENNFNKPFYCTIEGNRFVLKDWLIDIQSRQDYADDDFTFRNNKIYSPEYADKQAMYDAIDLVENYILGAYRYNPLADFSETWYAYVLYQFLGIGSAEDVVEFNRQYFKDHKPEIAEYYKL